MTIGWHVDRSAAARDEWFPVETVAREARGPFIQRIVSGELGGVAVPDVLDAALCEEWAGRLDARKWPVEPTRFAREFEAWSFGPCLDQSEGDVDRYFSRVPVFEQALEASVPETDVALGVEAALERLAGGLPVERPRASDGRSYGLLTLRGLPTGGLIPPHCENEQLPRASYDDLRARLDTSVLLSFYVTVRPSEAGGELSVHDLGPEAIGDRWRDGHSDINDEVDRSPAARLWFEPGTMVLFDGGRRFHQVLPVRGKSCRWTLGGFAALASDHTRLFAWA